MIRIKRDLIGRMAAGLLTVLISLPLQAVGVSSSAFLDLTNFTIQGSGFSFSEGHPVSTADLAAALGEVNDSSANATPASLLDLPTLCIGACPQIGSNVFPVISGEPASTFSTSDQFRSGSLSTGARIASGSYTAVNAGDNVASADSNNNLNGTFTVGTAGPVTVAFDVRAYLESFVSASEGFPGFSTAAYNVSISILNLSDGGQTIFSWSPNGGPGQIFGGVENLDPFKLNSTLSLNAPLPGDTISSQPHQPGVASQGRFEAVTNTLQPDQLYQLSIRVNANADASRIQVFSALGDRIWHDLNANGIQDCTDGGANDPANPADGIIGNDGDSGPECDAGIPNLQVDLLLDDCVTPQGAQMFTDSDGFYLFDNLDPGEYCVQFTLPTDNFCDAGVPQFTIQNVGNDASDSDADTGSGVSDPVSLGAGETNLTVDAGVFCPAIEEKAALGDRVWHDLDADGIQDCDDTNGNDILGDADDTGPECDAGIPDLTVNLLDGDCSDFLGTTMTNGQGFYLFEELLPGNYCVQFTLPQDDFCDVVVDEVEYSLGAPKFTLQNVVGPESTDSDANTGSGLSDSVNLPAGVTDLRVDAGVVCPAKIGDRVWQDDDKLGTQNGDEENVPGVVVKLYECTNGQAIISDEKLRFETLTDNSGGDMNYMFGGGPDDLPPGEYFVQFVEPDGKQFTLPNQGGDDTIDSDCAVDGKTSCVTLGSGDVDLTYDCGLIPPPPPSCDLTLDKQCRVEAPPVVSGDEKCDGKLKEFSVIWAGADGIFVSGPDNNSNGNPVNNGQEVTFTGPFSDNDVFVTISGAVSGESKFHMSCSDKDMDGWSETNEAQLQVSARDCGKNQGDAKSNGDPDFINDWLLEGFVDNSNQVLDCNAGSNGGGTFSDSCTVPPQTLPSCDTLGKPANLVFKYTGGGCSASSNSQKDDECSTTGGPLAGAVSIFAAGDKDLDKDIYTVMPDMVSLNETFGLTNGSSDLKSNSFIRITDANNNTELNRIHTSCSQDLVVGDVYGSLTLVGFDGQTGGVDVTYQYTVTNLGDPLTDVSVVDNLLGTVGGPVDLGNGNSATFTAMASITGTTVNTATASGTIAGSTAECQAADEVVVEFPEPPVAPVSCSDIKDITAVSAVWNGAGPVDVMGANSGEMFLGVQPGNRITFLRDGSGNDIVLNVSGAANGSSKFHVSCSDDDMNGTEDCGSDQGDGKGNDSSLINEWLFDGMTGENGSFDCGLPNSGVVDSEEGTGPSGGNVTAAPSLDLNDDKKVKWELTNSGNEDVFVTEVVVTWPAQHVMLKKFKLEGDFAKDVNDFSSPTSVDVNSFESDDNKRKLKKGDSKNLEIEFDEDYDGHSESDFTISVTFDNGQTLTFP